MYWFSRLENFQVSGLSGETRLQLLQRVENEPCKKTDSRREFVGMNRQASKLQRKRSEGVVCAEGKSERNQSRTEVQGCD